MHIIIHSLYALPLVSLAASIPQPGVHGHHWLIRNESVNALSSSSGGSSSPAVDEAAPATEGSTKAADSSTRLQTGSHCGTWDAVHTGGYTIQNLLWGQGQASSGKQCFGVDGLSGDIVAWHSDWTWSGNEYNVKSYSNANLIFTPKQLSAIKSIPSTWSYIQTGSSFRSDVSYDMFLADSAASAANTANEGGVRTYEIMVWLAGTEINPDGNTPIATTNVDGTNWKLYKGSSDATTVFSFVADPQITDYTGDLLNFYKYLIASQGVSGDQYLGYIGAGTEAFVGSDIQLKVTGYSCSIS